MYEYSALLNAPTRGNSLPYNQGVKKKEEKKERRTQHVFKFKYRVIYITRCFMHVCVYLHAP